MTLQLSTTEGNSYYVGTKMDAFVFDTLNSWYQEDMNTVSFPSSARLSLVRIFHPRTLILFCSGLAGMLR